MVEIVEQTRSRQWQMPSRSTEAFRFERLAAWCLVYNMKFNVFGFLSVNLCTVVPKGGERERDGINHEQASAPESYHRCGEGGF